MGCLSFENTRKFLFQLWFLFYRFRYLRRRNSYVTFFRESLSLYRWVVFWFSIFNKNNEEGVLRFLWNITENNKTFLHLDRSPYFRERTIRPHLGTKISSKKLSAGRRGWVDDRAKKGKASSPTLVPFPPPPPPLRELARKRNCCILTATVHRLSLIFHVFLLRSSCTTVIAFEQTIEKERNLV